MRFIVFNLVVIGALVYLIRGGDFWIEDALSSFNSPSQEQSTQDQKPGVTDDTERLLATMTDKLAAAEVRLDAVTQELDKTRKAQQVNAAPIVEQPPLEPQSTPEDNLATPLPPLEEVTEIAPLAERQIDPAEARPLDRISRPVEQAEPSKRKVSDAAAVNSPPAVDGLSPEVAARRAEVLGTQPANPTDTSIPQPSIALKEGTELMSPRDRLRALGDLTEELEIIYLEGYGG